MYDEINRQLKEVQQADISAKKNSDDDGGIKQAEKCSFG